MRHRSGRFYRWMKVFHCHKYPRCTETLTSCENVIIPNHCRATFPELSSFKTKYKTVIGQYCPIYRPRSADEGSEKRWAARQRCNVAPGNFGSVTPTHPGTLPHFNTPPSRIMSSTRPQSPSRNGKRDITKISRSHSTKWRAHLWQPRRSRSQCRVPQDPLELPPSTPPWREREQYKIRQVVLIFWPIGVFIYYE